MPHPNTKHVCTIVTGAVPWNVYSMSIPSFAHAAIKRWSPSITSSMENRCMIHPDKNDESKRSSIQWLMLTRRIRMLNLVPYHTSSAKFGGISYRSSKLSLGSLTKLRGRCVLNTQSRKSRNLSSQYNNKCKSFHIHCCYTFSGACTFPVHSW